MTKHRPKTDSKLPSCKVFGGGVLHKRRGSVAETSVDNGALAETMFEASKGPTNNCFEASKSNPLKP